MDLVLGHDGVRALTISIADKNEVVVRKSTVYELAFAFDLNDWRKLQRQFRWLSPLIVATSDDLFDINLRVDSPPTDDLDRESQLDLVREKRAAGYKEWRLRTYGD